MNLLFVDQFAHFGGAQKVFWQTLKSLDSPDVTVRVALNGAGKFKDALVAEGIPVLDLPLGNYSSGRKTIADIFRFCIRTAICAWKLVGYDRKNTVDLLYANGPRTFIATAMAGRWLRKPVIWHLQNVLTLKSEIWALQIFSRWVSRILVCSKAVADPLLAQQANLEARIRLVYNPLPDWDAVPQGMDYDLNQRDLCFGIVGRITPFKGQKCFLMAARTVLVHAPNTSFWVIGSPVPGDSADAVYASELLGFVEENRLQNSFRFLPHQDDVRKIFDRLDVIVVSSCGPEASPLVLIEAMSLGKPVIAPAHGGILEMIEDNRTGLLFKPGDHEQLSERMLHLIRSRSLGREIGFRARDRALLQFSRTRFQQIVVNELNECLKNQGRGIKVNIPG